MSSEEVAALAALTDSVDRSETVDCSEDDDGDECVVLVLAAHVERQDRHRVPLYVERVVPTYLEFEFRKLFRISRSLCADITGEFEASAFYPEGCRGRRQVSAHMTMLIALTYIGTQTTMYQIADKFDVSESTVHAAISRILDFLFSISKREICWPDPDERQRSKAAFCQIGRRGRVLPDVTAGPSTDAMSALLDPRSRRKAIIIEKSFIRSYSRGSAMLTWSSLTSSSASPAARTTPGFSARASFSKTESLNAKEDTFWATLLIRGCCRRTASPRPTGSLG
ncbi:uncharacterized protein LOC144106975 [Amblyomma americanum]